MREDLLVPAPGRLFVLGTETARPTALGTRRAAARHQLVAEPCEIEVLHLSALDPTLRPGDLVVETTRDGRRTWVHPPALVLDAPAAGPVLLRRPLGLTPYPSGIVVAGFRAAHLPVPDPLAPGEVTSRPHREALLDLWP